LFEPFILWLFLSFSEAFVELKSDLVDLDLSPHHPLRGW
jgi:hypothetical protein